MTHFIAFVETPKTSLVRYSFCVGIILKDLEIARNYQNRVLNDLIFLDRDLSVWITGLSMEFDKIQSANQITGFCQIIETGSRGSFWLVVSIIWQIQNLTNSKQIETNRFRSVNPWSVAQASFLLKMLNLNNLLVIWTFLVGKYWWSPWSNHSDQITRLMN